MNEMQHNPWLWSALKLAEKKGEHNRLSSSASALNRSFIQDFSRETIELTCYGLGPVHTHHCTHLYLHVPRESLNLICGIDFSSDGEHYTM